MSEKEGRSGPESAVRKLNAFFKELEPSEQKFIASLVTAGVIRAARAQGEQAWLDSVGDSILGAIRPDLAPELVNGLGGTDAGQAVVQPDAGQKLTPGPDAGQALVARPDAGQALVSRPGIERLRTARPDLKPPSVSGPGEGDKRE